jgi:Circularly permutated YpsA SLOG family
MLKIASGGQTGVDRAALDIARELGIAYRGWCPKGGWAEDLPQPPGILALYDLRETPDSDPRQRTEWNVRDSDRLMVLVDKAGLAESKGTAFAFKCAKRFGKPHVIIDIDAEDATEQATAFFGKGQGPLTLCIGGPRESETPGIYAKAREFLHHLLASQT